MRCRSQSCLASSSQISRCRTGAGPATVSTGIGNLPFNLSQPIFLMRLGLYDYAWFHSQTLQMGIRDLNQLNDFCLVVR